MRLALGSDHAGFRLKEILLDVLARTGFDVQDCGTDSEQPVDYPPIIRRLALQVLHGEADRGIVIGGSGNGEAMAANRMRGIRCAVCWNIESARLAAAHNDANLIALGARLLKPETAIRIVRVWLRTPFEAGRHARRIRQLDEVRPLRKAAN